LALLRWRLLFGALFIAALVLWCWLDANVARPGAFLLPLALMVSWLGAEELLAMLNKRGRYPLPWVVYTGVLLTVLLSGIQVFWPDAATRSPIGALGWVAIGLIAGVLLALSGELSRFGGQWHSTLNVGLAMLVITYVGGLMGMIVQLRMLGGGDARVGMFALVSLIATVKMSDTGQYFTGRLVGRHKLAPVVSPGKTWEGAIGGVVFAIGTAWFIFGWVAPRIVTTNLAVLFDPLTSSVQGGLRVVTFAIALAAAGLLGDLAESMLKRDAEVKDSSTWLPGFGGVLDLLDSLLGAAPVAYLLWAIGFVRA
jgi:phosphatidate cytidylyltransferase